VVEAVAVAFERRGITTVIDPASDYVLDAVLSSTEPALLGTWGRHRSAILEFADAVVTLGAWPAPIERASEGALRALRAGREMMEEVEARRALPFLAVAIATPRLADDLGLALETLDSLVRASLSPPVDTLRQLIEANISKATADPLVLRTSGCALRMKRGRRPWLHDDGHISTGDVASGAVTSNLPCGSIYTTVLEDSADGTVRVPELADGLDIVLTFNSGAITAVDGPGSETVMPWLAQFGPDAARISHIGIGLNDACPGGTGWPILDEHRAGAVFLALGENRYMGGTNASSLNHDLVLDTASIDAGSVPLVIDGHLAS
jgi:leucyl aminopeptidase (aminopeptidase T)